MPREPTLRAGRPGEASLISELAYRSKAPWGYPPRFMSACRGELTFNSEDFARLHTAVAAGPPLKPCRGGRAWLPP